jgi:hypothetical protein
MPTVATVVMTISKGFEGRKLFHRQLQSQSQPQSPLLLKLAPSQQQQVVKSLLQW